MKIQISTNEKYGKEVSNRMKTGVFYFILIGLCSIGINTTQGALIFDLLNEDSRNGVLDSTYAYQYNYSNSGVSLSVTGWTEAVNISQKYVGQWLGLGVERLPSPNHSIDNSNGYDMLLLSFDQNVALNSVTFGWGYNDTDMSVLALTGGSFSDFNGDNWIDLLSEGWESAGNYSDVPVGTPITIVPDLTAKYWLVGAYNPALGGPDYKQNGNPIGIGARDYFKLTTVTVAPDIIPVPGSIVLTFTGLALVRCFRRKLV